MRKSFFLSMLVFIASTLFLCETALSLPLQNSHLFIAEADVRSLPSQTQPKQPVDINSPEAASNIQTPNDSAPDRVSDRAPRRLTYEQPPHPYNLQKIEKFDRELYKD